jgi:ABC-type sugar transport system substrate-binding protein
MNKKLIILFIGVMSLFGVDNLPIKQQDVSPQQLQKQNRQIVKLAAQELSKQLPQKVDKYTTIIDIKSKDTSLVYVFEINAGAKSDEAIKKEDHSRMQQAITKGVCRSSKRFMDAKITIVYQYISAISKKNLFSFKIDQNICGKIK